MTTIRGVDQVPSSQLTSTLSKLRTANRTASPPRPNMASPRARSRRDGGCLLMRSGESATTPIVERSGVTGNHPTWVMRGDSGRRKLAGSDHEQEDTECRIS
jgi:hypothetical protein